MWTMEMVGLGMNRDAVEDRGLPCTGRERMNKLSYGCLSQWYSTVLYPSPEYHSSGLWPWRRPGTCRDGVSITCTQVVAS